MELTLELLRGGQPVPNGAHDPRSHHLLHETPTSGDIWALRITRKNDGSLDRRRYRINVLYPSVLPIEKRRIPLGFFKRGFRENWNDKPMIEWIHLRDNVFSYQWNKQFAGLHHKPSDNQHELIEAALGAPLKFPDIKSFDITLSAGGAANPMLGQPERFYFALRFDCQYLNAGSRDVELDLPGLPIPAYTLPEDLWIEARFFLGVEGEGQLCYYPKVSSPLFDKLDREIIYPTLSGMVTVNLKHEVTKAIENHLYHLQHTPDGNAFDRYLRPWIVGRYEVQDVVYDRVRDEAIVTYVGRQRPSGATLSATRDGAGWRPPRPWMARLRLPSGPDCSIPPTRCRCRRRQSAAMALERRA